MARQDGSWRVYRRSMAAAAAFSACVVGGTVSAQQALTATQELGQKLTSQSCVVCHFRLQHGVHTYGPRLSKDSLGGDEAALREVIANGTPRMPGFRHMLDANEIGAVVQFIKTLPPGPETQMKP